MVRAAIFDDPRPSRFLTLQRLLPHPQQNLWADTGVGAIAIQALESVEARLNLATEVLFVVCSKNRNMRAGLKKFIAAFAFAAIAPSLAHAHGIAGNRFFVGTMTFDDPSVADEAIVPNFSTLNHPVDGGSAVDNRFDWSFTRLLTPVLQVEIDSGWIHRNWPTVRSSGFATTDVGIKSEIYRNNQHEMLVAAGALWGIGRSGAQIVGADEPNSFQPGVFFGKGFGDLPDWLAWLRPLAITGAFVDELPFGTTTTGLAPNATGKFQSSLVPTVETLHWGLSLQYSTYYLTSRFTGGPPKTEPLNQLVPLVEFSFDSPRGQNTAATINPGFAYVAVTWQIAAEVIVPLNRDGGSSTGFRAQLMFFLDDLIPSLFGKPLFSDKPDRSLIAWH